MLTYKLHIDFVGLLSSNAGKSDIINVQKMWDCPFAC